MSSSWKKALSTFRRKKNKQSDTNNNDEQTYDWDLITPKKSSLSDKFIVEGRVSHPSIEQDNKSTNSKTIEEENVVIAKDMDDNHGNTDDDDDDDNTNKNNEYDDEVFTNGTNQMVKHRKKYNAELAYELKKLKEEHKELNERLRVEYDSVKNKNIVLANENETLKDKLFLFYICMIIITVLESLLVACFALR